MESSNSSKSKPTVQKSPKTSSKGIRFRLSPLLIIVFGTVAFLFLFQLSSGNLSTNLVNEKSLNQLVEDIIDGKVSNIITRNDGKVVVLGRYLLQPEEMHAQPGEQLDLTALTRNVAEVSFLSSSEFLEQVYNRSPIAQLRDFFGSGGQKIIEIILTDELAIAITESEKVFLSNELNSSNYFNVAVSSLGRARIDGANVLVTNISNLISPLDLKSFDYLTTEDLKPFDLKITLDTLGTFYILSDQYRLSYELDWNGNVASLPALLQAEGISLGTSNFSIISANIPEGVSLDLILQIVGFIFIGIIVFVIYKSLQGGGGMGISQFGQSKARLFFGSKSQTTFKDVAGIDEAREELNEVVQFLKTPGKFTKLGARIPKGILMIGSPGTGKTLLARAIAGEAGVPFFHTSGSEFEEMLVGAGASRVRDLFAKAKKVAPALIFIDEIDAVARKRGTRVNSGSNEQTLNQILVEMDGFETNTNVIVVAATNRPDVLDPAILRPGRFDRQIRIDLPDSFGRKQILEVHAKNKILSKSVNLNNLAKKTVGFSGAELENILNEAAIIAAKSSEKAIEPDHVEEAFSKVVLGPAKKSRTRTEKELKLVAYHEAGHALVAWFTPEATPVDRISIISRGMSGGVTMFLPEKDENIVTRGRLIAEITVSLGGRAAEEVALDDISTGASSDINKATSVAKRIVQKFGMSEKLGLIRYGDFEDSDYLGYAYTSSKDYSEQTANDIDKEIQKIISESYLTAIKILRDNRQKLDDLAVLLLEKEVLGKEEFEELMKK